ncbi:MAG: hypothetical protein KGI60_03355 [Patescibacteria group bacterium]|nr:hypothetical protein [Patescibacteria group bacterium]
MKYLKAAPAAFLVIAVCAARADARRHSFQIAAKATITVHYADDSPEVQKASAWLFRWRAVTVGLQEQDDDGLMRGRPDDSTEQILAGHHGDEAVAVELWRPADAVELGDVAIAMDHEGVEPATCAELVALAESTADQKDEGFISLRPSDEYEVVSPGCSDFSVPQDLQMGYIFSFPQAPRSAGLGPSREAWSPGTLFMMIRKPGARPGK